MSHQKGINEGYFDSDCDAACPHYCIGTWKTFKTSSDPWEIDPSLAVKNQGNQRYIWISYGITLLRHLRNMNVTIAVCLFSPK